MFRTKKLKINLVHPNAKMPTRAYRGDVGIDCYIIEDVTIYTSSVYAPVTEIRLGITLDIPKGHWVGVYTRGSWGRVGLHVHLGIIDEGFKGEITAFVSNLGCSRSIRKGEKVCQLILHDKKYDGVNHKISYERGENKHGSSNSI